MTNTQIPLQPQTLAKIKETTSKANHGIILISQQAMQSIFENSGPLAKGCEFQTHYWFLNLRYRAADNSILDIAIPTVYFNYNQVVSGAHIDFEMKDVSETSKKLLPVHNMFVNKLMSANIIQSLENVFLSAKFEAMSVDIGSIHKHPGSSSRQAFSGTDLDKSPTDHGVVYPLGTASDDKPNFAGIMALDGSTCNVAHYEYRTANGTLGTDLHYVKGRCLAIMINDKPDTRSDIEKMFYTPTPYAVKESSSIIPDSVTAQLVDVFRSLDFLPFTDAVRPENLVQKTYVQPTLDWTKMHATMHPFGKAQTPAVQPSLFDTKDEPTIYDDKKVQRMSKPELVAHLKALDDFYYEGEIIDDYEEFNRSELIEAVTELQALIVLDAQEEEDDIPFDIIPPNPLKVSLTDIVNELSSYGIPLSKLSTTPEATLRLWYANLHI